MFGLKNKAGITAWADALKANTSITELELAKNRINAPDSYILRTSINTAAVTAAATVTAAAAALACCNCCCDLSYCRGNLTFDAHKRCGMSEFHTLSLPILKLYFR
jgi:hypothetical protein